MYQVRHEFDKVHVTVLCNVHYGTKVLEIPRAEWDAWRDGVLIQNAMPSVRVEDRELLISGTCGSCFDALFESGEED